MSVRHISLVHYSLFVLSVFHQNLKGWLATLQYSGLENLYLRVEMNLGFISTQKDLTSATVSLRSSWVYWVNLSNSFPQTSSFFFNCLTDRISEAAAICEGLNFSRLASIKATSWINWAKKKTSLSSKTSS